MQARTLNIAFVDDSEEDRFLFKKICAQFPNIQVETFKSSYDFGLNAGDLDRFEVVFIDYLINSGSDAVGMYKAITRKSAANVVFISNSTEHYLEKWIDDPRVWGLISKHDGQQLIDWFEMRIEGMEPQMKEAVG